MSNSPLSSGWVHAHTSNYTQGRQAPISRITIHHMAGILTAQQCGGIFTRYGRIGSAHYGIGYDGEIMQYVGEEHTAWSDGNWHSNQRTVSIETANDEFNGNWHVSDAALNSLIRLVADIARRNNLGVLKLKENLFCHYMVGKTDCPGPYLKSKEQYICDEANKINYPPAQPAPSAEISYEEIPKKKVKLIRNTSLWNFNFMNWTDARPVKSFNEGTTFTVVAIATNKTVNAEYYVTEYSFSKKITNGLNVVDCKDYTEPIPEPQQPEAPLDPDTQPKPEVPVPEPEMPSKEEQLDNNLSPQPLPAPLPLPLPKDDGKIEIEPPADKETPHELPKQKNKSTMTGGLLQTLIKLIDKIIKILFERKK